jgi:hypothetical protein
VAKIYVSSTYLDLQEFREKILYHLHRFQQAVGAMEYYLADDRLPAAKCVADVKTCDIYVGVYAWRYGTIPEIENPDKLSITEMEYRAAREKEIPCLIFLHDGKSPWSPDLVDDDKKRIKEFRNKVGSEQTAQWFKTADELASLVGASLYDKLNTLGYTSHTMSVTTFDLEKYYSALCKRYGVLALEGLTPPQKEEYLQIQLRQVFVEQNVRENPPPVELPKEVWEKLSRDKEIHSDDLPSGITLDDVRRAREAYYEKPSRPVLDVLTDSRYPHAIILGDPGSGKSTLARYVMLSLVEGAPIPSFPRSQTPRTGEGELPLLIELRSYAGVCAEDKCESFLEFLEYLGKTEGWHLTQAALHNHLKNDGRAVVIFDGLDEIFEPELRERITKQIVGFSIDYPKARVIVTSRVIGYRRKILTDAGFTHFTLQDLDENQVETFVNRWYDLAMSDRPDEAIERRERILKSFKESASIRQLAGNPMLLTIMAIIGKHQELPRERWKLYGHAASVLIQHWDVNKHLKDARIDADFIGEDDKKELLRRLAFRMQGAGKYSKSRKIISQNSFVGNYIHREELQAMFEDYLKERYAQAPDRAVMVARAMIEQFRERNFILSLYGANLYGFVHRAFLEFFCASAFVYKFEKAKELTIEQLKTDVYGKHWKDQSWHEVLRLICGMVDERFAGDLIDHLIQGNKYSGYLELGSMPWNIALAVQCLSEVRNLKFASLPARHVLEAILGLFEHGMSGEPGVITFLEQQIVAFARSIGPDWPFRTDLIPWLRKFQPDYSVEYYYQIFGEIVGSIGAGLIEPPEIILDYARHMNWHFRILVPFTIGKGWRNDPRFPSVIRNLGLNDGEPVVRRVALSALAECFTEVPLSFPSICDRVVNDPDEGVREVCIDLLVGFYPDNPRTLSLLRKRGASELHKRVRDIARHAIWEISEQVKSEVELE